MPPVTPPSGEDGRPKGAPSQAGTWLRLLAIVVAVLTVNAILVARLDPAVARVKIPYSPTFLAQVDAKNVVTVDAKGGTLVGTFRKAITYPDGTKAQVTRFKDALTAPH